MLVRIRARLRALERRPPEVGARIGWWAGVAFGAFCIVFGSLQGAFALAQPFPADVVGCEVKTFQVRGGTEDDPLCLLSVPGPEGPEDRYVWTQVVHQPGDTVDVVRLGKAVSDPGVEGGMWWLLLPAGVVLEAYLLIGGRPPRVVYPPGRHHHRN